MTYGMISPVNRIEKEIKKIKEKHAIRNKNNKIV